MARFDVQLPPELEGGVYANLLNVWHTAHEFTLDFAATLPAQRGPGEGGEEMLRVPAKVTARVKIAPTIVFDVIRALNENMTRYEQTFGPISRPGQDEPTFPPDA